MREIVSPLSGPFTTFGQAPIDFYKVGAYRPELAYSFYNEYYRKGRQPVNFLQAIDHSATSNATMTGDYGPELVTNGSFDSDSDWGVAGTSSISDGKAHIYTPDGTTTGINQNGVMEIGKTYEVTLEVSDYVTGNISDTYGSGSYSVTGNGVYRKVYTAQNNTFGIKRTVGATDLKVDNISVREIPKVQWRPHNLLPYSEDFSASGWTKTDTTVTSNAAVAPDGTQTADEISHTANGGAISRNTNVETGVDYVGGLFAKYIDNQWLAVFTDSGSKVWFDIQNGVVGTDQLGSCTITEVSDGWYYLEMPLTAPDGSRSTSITLPDGDGSNTENTGTSAYIWGAHLYRSDLGGMADVPADARVIPSATTYVRTAGREVTGTELVTNGTFDTDTTGWTQQSVGTSSFTVSSGEAYLDRGDQGAAVAYTTITTVSGKLYSIQMDKTSGFSILQVGTGVSSGSLYNGGNNGDDVSDSFTATGSTTYITVTNNQPSVAQVDNISVKEIDVDPSAARYLPRRGHHVYNGSLWVNKGLLHESESRTNLVTYSNDFTDASWIIANTNSFTVTSNQAVGPDGLTSMDKIEVTDSTSETHAASITEAVSIGVDATRTVSCYLRDGDQRYVALRHFNSTNNWVTTVFDLQGGTVAGDFTGSSSGTALQSGVEDVGNGVYRAYISSKVTTTDGGSVYSLQTVSGASPTLNANGEEIYAGTGGEYFYAYGFQVEAGSIPSSYIPTSGSTATRAAETLTIPAENLPWPSPVYVTNEELVTNGTFDSDSDWTKGTGWTISGGVASCNGATNSALYQDASLVQGTVYRAEFEVVSAASGKFRFEYDSDDDTSTYYSSVGTYEKIFVADSSTLNRPLFRTDATSGFNGSIDNISVKEINPLALSIQMSGEMTYADEDQNTQVWFVIWQSDGSNKIAHYLNTSSTAVGRLSVQQADSNNYSTISPAVGSTLELSPGVNVPFNYAGRHGSTFVNSAYDGVALAGDTSPVALHDQSANNLRLCHLGFMGTIDTFRVWSEDIGDTGIAEATEPSEEATLFLSFDGTETSYVNFDWSE